jgi:hypothetical protein
MPNEREEVVVIRIAKHVVAAFAAVLLLGLAVDSASARSFSTSTQAIRATFASVELAAGATTIRCRATLEGSFHTGTIPKVARSLIGAVTRAVVAHPCTNGEAWADNGSESEPLGTAPNRLPFHITYESFSGTLPNISGIGLLYSRFSFVIQATLLGTQARCRYGRAEDNISLTSTREAAGAITGISTVAGRTGVTLVDGLLGGGVCAANGNFTASGVPTILNGTTAITITLI